MQHVTRLPAKHTRVYNQLKDGGERGQESLQMSLITTASCFLKHCRSFLTIGRVFLVVFWSAARLLAFPLMSTICSHSQQWHPVSGTRQHWWCPSVDVAGGIDRRFLKDLVSICQSCSLGSGWLFSISGVGGSSHSRTVRAFAHLILHNHVNDLRNARFWTLVFK